MEEVSKIVSVEDMPAVPSSCGNALSQGDDFFVYLLITMPFNQLIAAYTSVGSSLIENPARRASVDGAGLWLLNNDNVVWFIELPVMLLGMFASFSILLAPLLAIVATKVDTIRRTRQNEIVRGYARDGLDNFGKQMTGPRNPKIHGPIVIRKRKQWRKWRKKRPKVPFKILWKSVCFGVRAVELGMSKDEVKRDEEFREFKRYVQCHNAHAHTCTRTLTLLPTPIHTRKLQNIHIHMNI